MRRDSSREIHGTRGHLYFGFDWGSGWGYKCGGEGRGFPKKVERKGRAFFVG